MEFLIVYAIFCATTAFTSVIALIIPVVANIKDRQPLNQVAVHSIITYITSFCLSALLAPFMLLTLLIPSMGEVFKDSLSEALLDN